MAERGWLMDSLLCLLKTTLFILLSLKNVSSSIPLLEKTVYPAVSMKQYRDFSSSQIYKFNVPQNAHSALWEVTANASLTECPEVEIHMLIQPAGYPLNPNTSFPHDFYLHRTDLQIIKLTSPGVKDGVKDGGTGGVSESHTVPSPAPGTWFGAAYIVGNTDVVIKKMTDLKCQYTLSVNMTVFGYDYIPEVRTNTVNHPQHLYLQPQQTLSYLKFRIGKRTWSYDVTVSQCYWSGVLSDPCPLILYVRSVSLPSLTQEETLYKNCSTVRPGEACHITAVQPIADSYQYMMLLKPGGNLSFTISVSTKECGDATHHFFSDEGGGRHRVKRYTHSDDVIVDPHMRTNYRNMCISAMPLYRTTEVVNNFFTTYALKPSSLEFVENIVPVPSLYARLFYFNVVQGQDTGGTITFNIKVNTTLPQPPSSVKTNLTVCLQRGNIPVEGSSIRCHPRDVINLASLPRDINSHTVNFPYPEAGTWYLALQQNCYTLNKTTSLASPADCPHQLLLTHFNLHSMPCVSQKCGDYGQCVEYAGATHAFSVCDCKANLKGYACDDWSGAKPRHIQVLYTMLLTLSNLFFVPAVILAIYRHRFTEAFIYFANMFFSSFYHACDMGPWSVYTLCIMPYHVLQYCDFLLSILSIWFTLVAVSEIRQPIYSLSHMVAVIILAMAVQWNLHGLLPYILPIALGLLIIFINFGVKSYRRKRWYPGKRRLLVIGVGILLAAAGICSFAFFETDSNYPYTHSFWHMAMCLSILFFLPPKTVNLSLSGSLSSSSDDFDSSILDFNPNDVNDLVNLVPADRTTAAGSDTDDKDEPLLQDI